MERDFVTVVSGLPRSGTSLMMQMLHAGGLPTVSDGIRRPDDSNPRGYFEDERVKRLRSDRSWLPQARGRAVKIIHLLLRELLLDGSLHYRIVFMERPLDEVLASQRSMLLRGGAKPADEALVRKAFETQLSQLQAWMATQPLLTVLRMPYHQVLREPGVAAQALDGFLGGGLDRAAMAGAVEPALHRERTDAANGTG
ncbi:hypothetical protein [Roseateles sp.]|uniref:hypothetical protein n=1 Tax=Roseateles sp. TaxID=1971397 RepID=UPI003BAA71DF